MPSDETLPRWRRWLSVRTKISDHTIGILGLVVGFTLGAGGILAGLESSGSIEERYNTVALLSILLAVLGILVIFYIVRETFSIQKAFVELNGAHDSLHNTHLSLTKAHEEALRSASEMHRIETRRVAPAFNTLSRVMRSFEMQLLIYSNHIFYYALKKDAMPPTFDREDQERWDNFKTSYDALLLNICTTAQVVIGEKKAGGPKISVNLKIMDRDPPVYIPICRSFSDARRRDEDENLKNNPIQVAHNRMYDYILRKIDEDAEDCYCLVPDNDLYVRETAELRVSAPVNYYEPKSASTYGSCLVVPLLTDNISGAPELNIRRRHDKVGGFFCIDSSEKSCFNKEYDLEIMRELANYASSAIRSCHAAGHAREVLLRASNRSPHHET